MQDENGVLASVEWARTMRMLAVGLFALSGFLISWLIGGRTWIEWYAIIIVVIAGAGGIYYGIYTVMALLAHRDENMAKAFGDLLFAHSQSGAYMAKAITEVVRGVNQINKADADVQMALTQVGANYEKRLAQLAFERAAAQGELRVLQEAPKLAPDNSIEGRFSYMLPDSQGARYQLPEVK